MSAVRCHIEVFQCRRVSGWGAFVWYWRGHLRRIYHVSFAATADAAHAAAEIWLERLRRLGDGE